MNVNSKIVLDGPTKQSRTPNPESSIWDHKFSALNANGGKLPVVLGVTGHRDLPDIHENPEQLAKLEQGVRTVFSEIKGMLQMRGRRTTMLGSRWRWRPGTNHLHTPVILLSPLAEGADRLVARIFLEEFKDQPGSQLVVPLPLPLEEYVQDFDTEESRCEFHELCMEAARVIDLGLVQGNTSEGISQFGEQRNRQYEQVGVFVARHSQILVALWNGEPSDAVGGTAQIVTFRREGIPESYRHPSDPLDAPEYGPGYHVHTPRKSNPVAPDCAGQSTFLYPSDWRSEAEAKSVTERLLAELEDYNRDAAVFLRRHEEKVKTSAEYLLPRAAVGEIRLSDDECYVRSVFEVADAMAIYNQRRAFNVTRVLHVLPVVAVALNQILGSFVSEPWVAIVYAGLLILGVFIYLIGNWHRWQQKYLNYRALAEAFRVQFFWRLAGVKAHVADSYLRGQRDELDGIRQAMRFADLGSGRGTSLGHTGKEFARLKATRKHWLKDQVRYFLGDDQNGQGKPGVVDRDAGKATFWNWIANIGVAFALGLVFGLALDWPVEPYPAYILALSALSLAVAAASASYSTTRGFAEHARNQKKLARLFERADQKLHEVLLEPATSQQEAGAPNSAVAQAEELNPEQIAEARTILQAIGKEALAENGDWTILHRDRPWQLAVG